MQRIVFATLVHFAACTADVPHGQSGTSEIGESCAATGDCVSGLRCIELRCITPSPAGDAAGDDASDAGSANSGTDDSSPGVTPSGRTDATLGNADTSSSHDGSDALDASADSAELASDGGASDGATVDDSLAAINPTPGCYKTSDAPYPGGLLPGFPCEHDHQCKHGLCTGDNPRITAGNFKVCAKRCGGCPGFTPSCTEDGGGSMYTCVKPLGSKGKLDHCAIRCDSSSEVGGLSGCQAISPHYTRCGDQNAGKAYCGAD